MKPAHILCLALLEGPEILGSRGKPFAEELAAPEDNGIFVDVVDVVDAA